MKQSRKRQPPAAGRGTALILVLLLSLSVLLSGCGAGSEAPAAQSSRTAEETAEPSAQPSEAEPAEAVQNAPAEEAAEQPAHAGETTAAESVRLPVCSDYPDAPEWDGISKPTRENGSWAQTYAVFDALAAKAKELEESVAPERTFTLAVHDPAESGPGQLAGGWANAVAVATEGRVRINVGYSASLSGAMSSMDDMKQGLIDFVWTLPCYFKGYMPLTNVIQNPALALPSGSAASRVMWELYKQSPELQAEAANNGVLLFTCANCTSPLSYKGNDEITSTDAIHGNIRANNGPAQLFVSAAGATVFSCPIGEVYNNIQHGIIDFLITDWNGIDSFSLSDSGVLDHYVDTNIGCSAFAMIANAAVWDTINPELQEMIRSASGDYMLNLTAIWDYWEALGRYNAVTKGGTVYQPSPEFEEQLEALYGEVAETWIDSMESPETARQLYERAQSIADTIR